MSMIRDLSLAEAGHKKIAWVRDYMPVLSSLEKEYSVTRPLQGLKVSVCVHLEAKTAYLCYVLRAAGAEVYATGSNSKLLSKDVLTEFRGRGDEIHLNPLSSAEIMPVCS